MVLSIKNRSQLVQCLSRGGRRTISPILRSHRCAYSAAIASDLFEGISQSFRKRSTALSSGGNRTPRCELSPRLRRVPSRGVSTTRLGSKPARFLGWAWPGSLRDGEQGLWHLTNPVCGASVLRQCSSDPRDQALRVV